MSKASRVRELASVVVRNCGRPVSENLDAELRQVRGAFNLGQLQRRCQLSVYNSFMDLSKAGGVISGEPKQWRAFKDNGADVLAVAHLDTVQDANTFRHLRLSEESVVFCPRLDDRLGVYIILDLLPRLGIKVDVLLTENEEIGRSTAIDFTSSKPYNWMFQFDRCGEDAVTYDYEWEDTVGEYFEYEYGTFSDICRLEHLGCNGVNIGVGYHDEHSLRAYANLSETFRQVARFLKFYRAYHDVPTTHEIRPRIAQNPTGFWDRTWPKSEVRKKSDHVGWCPFCYLDIDEEQALPVGYDMVCRECGTVLDMYMTSDTWWGE